MERRTKGFGLIELMFAIVLTTIVMIAVYKYWISGTRKMSDTVRLATMKITGQRAFNIVENDLKQIGYNPKETKKDPMNGNIQYFGILDSEVNPPNDMDFPRQSPFDSIEFSFYSQDADSAYTTDPADLCNSTKYCTRMAYYVNNGSLWRRYFDPNSASNPTDQALLSNVCVRFILWDANNNIPCTCQIWGRRCPDTNGSNACETTDFRIYPTMIKLIVATAINQDDAARFTSNDSGCFDNDPDTPCEFCEIPNPKASENPNLPPYDRTRYIRFEKTLKLINLGGLF